MVFNKNSLCTCVIQFWFRYCGELASGGYKRESSGEITSPVTAAKHWGTVHPMPALKMDMSSAEYYTAIMKAWKVPWSAFHAFAYCQCVMKTITKLVSAILLLIYAFKIHWTDGNSTTRQKHALIWTSRCAFRYKYSNKLHAEIVSLKQFSKCVFLHYIAFENVCPWFWWQRVITCDLYGGYSTECVLRDFAGRMSLTHIYGSGQSAVS